MRITLTPPTKSTPGFNKRSYNAMRFQDAMKNGTMNAQLYREMVEFLAEFISVELEEGETPMSKAEALFEYASQDDMETLMSALAGGGAQVPPVS